MTEIAGSSKDCIFIGFLKSLSSSERHLLLSKSSSAFFVFRMIPPVVQQVVVQLIWNSNSASQHLQETVELKEGLQLLKDLNIVTADEKIEQSFRRAYLRAVMNGSIRCSSLRVEDVDEKKRIKDVAKKSLERWDCILRYLALPSEQNMTNVSSTTKSLFNSAGYTSGDGERDIEITSTGFQFLLLNPVQQLWLYIIEYLKLEIKNRINVIELLELLIEVILCANKGFEPGKDAYALEDNWTERQQALIAHLRELGVISIRKTRDGVFFLTPLIAHLATNENMAATEAATSEKPASGGIIVETNFRLYAYTSSPLQLAILSTFTEMTYRFNDMSVGMLTRESVRRALQVGVTAAQIISFLRTNAHAQCLASGGPLNCLPITVSDQIRLWEDERKRMNITDSIMYSVFEGENEFTGVRDYAAREGVLLWADSNQKLVIVTEEGHELVRQWWKANKRANQ